MNQLYYHDIRHLVLHGGKNNVHSSDVVFLNWVQLTVKNADRCIKLTSDKSSKCFQLKITTYCMEEYQKVINLCNMVNFALGDCKSSEQLSSKASSLP